MGHQEQFDLGQLYDLLNIYKSAYGDEATKTEEEIVEFVREAVKHAQKRK